MSQELSNWHLGTYESAVQKRLRAWDKENFAQRMWDKDPSVWSQQPDAPELTDRLGWLYLPQSMQSQISEINAFAEEIRSQDYRHVLLLGMGGSSLAPEVLQGTFGNSQGYPELRVLDSTHPDAVRYLSRQIDPAKTLFLVSSKSGTTLETLTLFEYFWHMLGDTIPDPGRNFVAITDPGTPLVKSAQERGFRRTFLAPPDVGGRYSALSVFGIVPAALIGVDIALLLNRALQTADACKPGVNAEHNPGIALGAALGELGIAGRDKLTFVPGAELATFPLWLEQLIAESTGKNNTGLIPVAGEPLGEVEAYGSDRVFISLSLGKPDTDRAAALLRLQEAGHPVLYMGLTELAGLGSEFFRWEVAVAAAGAILRIHPFDQPDVQLAKDLARKAMQTKPAGTSASQSFSTGRKPELLSAVQPFLQECTAGRYIGIQAYLSPEPEITSELESLRRNFRNRLHAAVSIGFGPRFLHSTGQLHKGGPNSGLFLQLVDQPKHDVDVPGKDYSFGKLIRAQADGDLQALQNRGRRVLRIDLGQHPAAALRELAALL